MKKRLFSILTALVPLPKYAADGAFAEGSTEEPPVCSAKRLAQQKS